MVSKQNMDTRLVVNTRFTRRRLTGVERYSEEIIRRLSNHFKGDLRNVSPSGNLPWWLGHIWEQLRLPFIIKPGEILWSPANTGPLLVSDQILTVHDLSWLDCPQSYQSLFVRWYRYLLPRLIQRARRVITVSEHIKVRMISRYQIGESRVSVVPGGVDGGIFKPIENTRQILKSYALPEKYVLYIGTLGRHKNLNRLCEAWELVQQRSFTAEKDIHLVLAGAGGSAFRKIELPFTQRVVCLGYVPEGSLPALYSSALAFINPSLCEGFGLTLLEAMSCNTAVVASRAGSLPEVAGDAALFFDPQDSHEMAVCLERVIQDGDLRRDLQRRGLERAKLYSWDAAAERAYQILQEIG